MKRVVIGFSRPIKFKIGAKLIMWADGSNFSHAYIRFESERWKTSFIYQATGHGTHFMGGQNFRKINVPVEEFQIEVPDDVEAKVGSLCVSREGQPYAVKQVMGKAVVKLIQLLTFGKLTISNPLGQADQTDCIDEVSTVLKDGLGIQTPLDMDSVSVKAFRDWVAGIPGAKGLVIE